ncbi:MAG: hypothetical protein M1830_001941 [Pleopsidium flavum]|nr:MAG: hypothetical protein M1830_001941 [Pleopsidium flavum]
MAPTLTSVNWQHHLPPLYNDASTRRGLGAPLEFTARFSLHQIYLAQALALAAASVSVASSIVTLYWYFKMKRNFRHHCFRKKDFPGLTDLVYSLIMLLIQSDLFKAVWFLINMAIIMIAIHTASFIFKPAAPLGQGGLYRYRYYAYVLWVVFPLVMASLPFLEREGAFITQGGYCYIQVRPFWYRLALSWIPRYLIFFSIICIYVAIYTHVHFQFRGFMADHTHSYKSHRTWLGQSNKQQDDSINLVHRREHRHPPATPTLERHGLLPSSEEASILDSRRHSTMSASAPDISMITDSTIRRPNPIAALKPAQWDSYTLNAFTPSHQPTSEGPQPADIPPEITDSSASTSPDSSHTRNSRSIIHIRQALKRPPPAQLRNGPSTPPDSEPHTPVTIVDFLDGPDLGPDLATEQLRKRRQHIQRQLKFLFIYPLVYMLMWMVPFSSHCLQYSDHYASHPYFALSTSVTVIIALQCAVDCLLFSTREKPWRLIPGSKGTFCDSFLFWTHGAGPRDGMERLAPPITATVGSGFGAGNMMAETRDAVVRRGSDMRRASQVSANEMRKKFGGARKGQKGDERSWWDVEGRLKKDSVLLGVGTGLGGDGSRDRAAKGGTRKKKHRAWRRGPEAPIAEEEDNSGGSGGT